MDGSRRTPTARARRFAVALWIVLSVALWNAIFEMMVIRGVKEYLFRAALSDAGRGPRLRLPEVMDPMIVNATWVATLWTSVILLAAFTTIRALEPAPPRDA